jgi:hypothetical protein
VPPEEKNNLLIRVSVQEARLLAYYRSLPPADQEYVAEILTSLFEVRQKQAPTNVILLADPCRKFTRRV